MLGESMRVLRSVIEGVFTDTRWTRVSALGLLILVEILFALLVAAGPGNWYMILAAAVGLTVVAATFRKPVFGLYLFVVTAFTEGLFMVGSVSVARLLGTLVLAAWLVRSLAPGRFEIAVPSQGWFAALFILWGLTSAMWAADTRRLCTELFVLLQLMGLYILVINLLKSARSIQAILVIVAGVSLVLAALTVSRALSGDLVRGRADLREIAGGGPNSLAVYLLPGAILLLTLSAHRRHLVTRVLLVLGLSVVCLAILATSSRAGVASLAIVVAIAVIADHSTWWGLLPALLAGGVAMLLLPHTFLERMASFVTLSDRAAGRLDIWLVAMQIIRSRPLLGVGLGNFPTAFDRHLPETPGVAFEIGSGRASHNVFLNVQSELGVIGSGLFAILIAMTLRSGLIAVANFRRAGSSHMAALALAVWLGLVGALVAGLLLDLQYWKLFWLLLALPEAMRRVSEQAPLERASA